MTSASNSNRLQEQSLQSFISGFMGYGNLNAPYWYIGMEEGGGNDLREIARRLDTWESMGSSLTVDVKSFHQRIGIDKFFSNTPLLQSTWSKLIRVHLELKGQESDTEAIRSYQSKSWGRSDTDSCLLELMPLPSPSANNWSYNQFSGLHFLQSRKAYWRHVLTDRIKRFRSILEEFTPKLVLFYGLSDKYFKTWTEIIGSEPMESEIDRLFVVDSKHTIFAVCPHPVAHGLTNNYFNSLGSYLRGRIRQRFGRVAHPLW